MKPEMRTVRREQVGRWRLIVPDAFNCSLNGPWISDMSCCWIPPGQVPARISAFLRFKQARMAKLQIVRCVHYRTTSIKALLLYFFRLQSKISQISRKASTSWYGSFYRFLMIFFFSFSGSLLYCILSCLRSLARIPYLSFNLLVSIVFYQSVLLVDIRFVASVEWLLHSESLPSDCYSFFTIAFWKYVTWATREL